MTMPDIKKVPKPDLRLYVNENDDDTTIDHNSFTWPNPCYWEEFAHFVGLVGVAITILVFAFNAFYMQSSDFFFNVVPLVALAAFVIWALTLAAEKIYCTWKPWQPLNNWTFRHVFTNTGLYMLYVTKGAETFRPYHLPFHCIATFEITPAKSWIKQLETTKTPHRYGHFEHWMVANTWELVAFMQDGSEYTLMLSGWGVDEQTRLLLALKKAHADALKATKNDKATLERAAKACLDMLNQATPPDIRAASAAQYHEISATMGWANT